MENFFHYDKFYSDLSEFATDIDNDRNEEIPDEEIFEIFPSEKDKLVTFSVDWIIDRIDEDRFSEYDNEYQYQKIEEALKKHINFEALNAEIPELYYMIHNLTKITGKELKENL